jgi:arsenate reductase (glutaredoxin)
MNKTMVTIYGIPNCDVTKEALKWLKANEIAFNFHDYKLNGISREKLQQWDKQAGWKNFFNKRSTTWKLIAPKIDHEVKDAAHAFKIMIENNSIIKRPIVEAGKKLLIGFNEQEYIDTLIS